MTPEEMERACDNISQTLMGAIGGGPPLRYLWIPFAMVALLWLAMGLLSWT